MSCIQAPTFPTGNSEDASTLERLDTSKSAADSDQTSSTKHSGEYSTSDDSVLETADSTRKTTWSQKYTAFIRSYEKPFIKCLIAASRISARNPWKTVWLVTILSFVLVGVGFFTGFNLETSETKLWTPANSISSLHRQWLRSEADFPNDDRIFAMFFHANGGNVLKMDYVAKVFDVMETIRNQTQYAEICSESDRIAPDGIYEAKEGENRTCEISGIPAFFSYQRSIFEQQVRDDDDVRIYLSLETYPDFRPVSRSTVMGKATWAKDEFGNETGLLETAQSYTLAFLLPDTEQAKEWDVEMVDVVLDIKKQWAAAGSELVVEVITESSFAIEFTRTIIADLPLIPFVYLIMSGFTALVFAKRHKVESRSGLGFAAVFCVLLSIMSGYGLAFLFAVPFTSMTQLLPFLLFGIGLDDAFIISGSYARTDPQKDLVLRVEETIEEVGLSITLTSLTSATAFALGCTSSVPAVNWLVLYAFPTVIIILIYQLTFFVATIVIDEQRIAANRRDCCCWIKAPDTHPLGVRVEGDESAADRFMSKLGIILMKPKVKILVIIVFAAFAAICGWRVTLLEQKFSVRDVLPDGSYMTDFVNANQEYTDEADVTPYLYFRSVDQSDPATQKLMSDFIDTVVHLPQVSSKPARFWLDHFHEFVNMTEGALELPFHKQLDLFLDDPVMRYIHYGNIMRDDMGNVEVSRVGIDFDEVGYEVVREEIAALRDSQEATAEFEINQGLESKDWPFFIYSSSFSGWEFYARCIYELTMSTFSGVFAVTFIGVFMIPHWTAGPILFPFVVILYIDLLGVAEMAGIKVNAVSYIGMTMSIGLIVDYIMHCMLRYYEVPGNREEKCIEMLRTIGVSVLLGGMTTFLGTLLLVFASSDIFFTFFVIFFGIVVLGVSHGLILLPVVLSIIGPEEQVSTSIAKKSNENQKPSEKKVFIYI